MLKRFLPALTLFVLIVATAPAIGHVRDFLFDTFGNGAVRSLLTGFALVAVGVVIYALVKIHERRWLRYGGIGVVAALLWFQTFGMATGSAKVDAVEKIHILEYGLLAFLLYRALLAGTSGRGDLAMTATVLYAVTLAGTLDEAVQWLVPQRTGEIRDVTLNVVAGLTGLLFALCLVPPKSWTWRLGEAGWRRLAHGGAVTVLGLGTFFYVAHLGYEIEDPEIGRFRSRFTAAGLLELQAMKTEDWATDPPTGLTTWDIEDDYLSEAGSHVQHRNTSWDNGVYSHAWLANRILEKYYDPFLDIESFKGFGRHRYPPNRRQELEAMKGKINAARYLSPVDVNRLRVWPKPLVAAVILAVVLALWALPSFLKTDRSTRR